MKGINEDGSELKFSFGPDGVVVGENKFVKTQTLLQSSSYSVYPYYNSKGKSSRIITAKAFSRLRAWTVIISP